MSVNQHTSIYIIRVNQRFSLVRVGIKWWGHDLTLQTWRLASGWHAPLRLWVKALNLCGYVKRLATTQLDCEYLQIGTFCVRLGHTIGLCIRELVPPAMWNIWFAVRAVWRLAWHWQVMSFSGQRKYSWLCWLMKARNPDRLQFLTAEYALLVNVKLLSASSLRYVIAIKSCPHQLGPGVRHPGSTYSATTSLSVQNAVL